MMPIQACNDGANASFPPQQSIRKSRYVPRSFVQHDYHDRSAELPDCVPNVTRGGVSTLFPHKLFAALDLIASQGLGHICSWQPHGRAFVVHKPREFEAILPRFFGRMKFSSFQRQLNLYGFSRLTHGPDKGGYYHELFLRGRDYLCRRIQRRRVKGNGSRSATNPDAEPNFYAMPPVGPLPQAFVASMRSPISTPVPVSMPPMPQIGLPARHVSLTEQDFCKSHQPDSAQSMGPTDAEPVADTGLDDDFWNAMETFTDGFNEELHVNKFDVISLDNVRETSASFTKEEMDLLNSIVQPLAEEVESAAPANDCFLPTSMDKDLSGFLQEVFKKEESSTNCKVQPMKGVSQAGGANAVAFARRGTFRHRNSFANAAA